MKRIVTPKEMQEIDRTTIEDRGISGDVLMENAGRSVYDRMVSEIPDVLHRRILVICGRGNNGGDGFVVARWIQEAGTIPEVAVLGEEGDLKGDALHHYQRLTLRGIRPTFVHEAAELASGRPDVLVDALLGTGTKGELEGQMLAIIKTINCWKAEGTTIVSVDIPSGLNGESGEASEAVMADMTVTMGLPKLGLLIGEGKHYCGKLHVADIGFPPDLTDGGDLQWIEPSDVRNLFPRRYHQSHKYDYGRILIIAGSRGMTGAAVLCARAALRSGAGLVRVAMPSSCIHVIENGVHEALTVPLPETSTGSISLAALKVVEEQLIWCEALAIGPGLSRHAETIQVIQEILRRCDKPTIVDADALIAWSSDAELSSRRGRPTLMTPHTGEFKGMSGVTRESALEDRIGLSREFVHRSRVTLLLKGSPTIVTDSSGRSYITSTGNPGMATAGSGDVLTGMVAAFVGQRMTMEQAAYGASFLHGLAGDLARRQKTEPSLTAGDLIDHLPFAFKETGVW